MWEKISLQGHCAAIEFFMVQKKVLKPKDRGEGNNYNYANKNV